MRKLFTCAAVAATVLAARPVSAQTCMGRPSFAEAPWQARLSAGFSDDSKTFGPAIVRGVGPAFVGITSDLTGYPTIDQSAVSLGATIGAERALDARVFVCPLVTALHQFGPNVSGADLSSNVVAGGGRVGIIASENQTLQVVPTFGVDAQWERDAEDVSGVTTSASRTFTVTRLGVGFVLNKRTAVVPEILEIFGTSANTTVRLTVAFAFGK